MAINDQIPTNTNNKYGITVRGPIAKEKTILRDRPFKFYHFRNMKGLRTQYTKSSIFIIKSYLNIGAMIVW
jgi:hypothetical protein